MLTAAADRRQGPGATERAATRATTATAVLLATAATPEGAPAAAQRWDGTTLVARLAGQLSALGVRHLHVVTRAAWAPVLQPTLDGATVHTAESAAEGLGVVAELAAGARGALVIAYADVVTQDEVLARLLADPRVATGALTSMHAVGRPYNVRLRARRGRVLAASSPYHAVRVPNSTFLGVLKIADAERGRVAAVARRLAALAAEPPAAWQEELAAKAERWRRWLAAREAARRGEELPPVEERDALPLSREEQAELDRRLAEAPDDVAALLLVGLVRDGAAVGLSRLRGLFWARPLSADAVGRAREQIEHHDEERALLDSAVKANDGFFTTFFVSPYSKYVARWAARRGLTPNQVTLASLAVGIAAAVAFATGERAGLVAGALLLQVAFMLDCVDGQLARYTRTFSVFGAWLDSMFDRAKEYLVYAGLAIGASRVGEPVWGLAAGMLALQTSRHAVDFSFPAVRRQVFGMTPQPPIEEPLDGPRRGGGKPVDAPAPAPRRGARRRVLALWHAGDGSRAFVWVKKIVAFPIGERFAAISVTAALFSPRTTFLVLLVWGGVGALYVVAGRAVRSLST